MEKRILQQSEKFYKDYQAALAVDHSAEIDRLGDEAHSLLQERQRVLARGDSAQAERLKTEADNRRHRIVYLGSSKQNGASDALAALKRFNQPHVKGLVQRLERLYVALERQKIFATLGADELLFGGHRLVIESNLLPVLEAQVKIAEVFEGILSFAGPLGDLVRRVELLEKSTPSDFPAVTIRLNSPAAAELGEFRVPHETLDVIDYRPHILPSEILRGRIAVYQQHAQSREALAA